MNLRAILFPAAPSGRASLGLLAVRAFAGATLMTHGWSKIQNPLHWMDKMDSPPPAVFQLLAAVAEFFGGLGLVVGALTVIASFGIGCTMVVAINFHVSKGDPFGKWELAALYLVISLLLLCSGPGAFSVDRFLAQRRPAAEPGAGTAVRSG